MVAKEALAIDDLYGDCTILTKPLGSQKPSKLNERVEPYGSKEEFLRKQNPTRSRSAAARKNLGNARKTLLPLCRETRKRSFFI